MMAIVKFNKPYDHSEISIGLAFHYQCYKTEEFDKAFRKLDNSVQKIIDKAIQEILLHRPYESKRLVSSQYKGKRSLRKGDYRIIFAICEECRKLNEVHLNGCKNCKKHGTNDIIMFTCGHRKHIYDE